MNNTIVNNNNQTIQNEYDFENNDFEYDDEENISIPIPSKFDILIGNEMEEFEVFKRSILSDKSIDQNIKQILIQSRMEQLEKIESKTKINMETAIRSGIVSILIVRLKNDTYTNIGIEQKKYLINQIDKWIDGKIQVIKLESEILFELYELIDTIKIMYPNVDDIKIKNIFEPKNLDDYLNFIDAIEQIKIQSIKEEQERINKKIEKEKIEEELKKIKEEEEEIKNIEIKKRESQLNVLIFNLNKLSFLDIHTKNLKIDLEVHINKFIGLETNYIELKYELYEKICKFINSIRIDKENKQQILSLIKIVE